MWLRPELGRRVPRGKTAAAGMCWRRFCVEWDFLGMALAGLAFALAE